MLDVAAESASCYHTDARPPNRIVDLSEREDDTGSVGWVHACEEPCIAGCERCAGCGNSALIGSAACSGRPLQNFSNDLCRTTHTASRLAHGSVHEI